jgi:hypothetical protein
MSSSPNASNTVKNSCLLVFTVVSTSPLPVFERQYLQYLVDMLFPLMTNRTFPVVFSMCLRPCLCPVSVLTSMSSIHVHVRCSCPVSISVSTSISMYINVYVHVNVHVHVHIHHHVHVACVRVCVHVLHKYRDTPNPAPPPPNLHGKFWSVLH